MANTLQDLLNESRARKHRSQALAALKVYRLLLEAAPLDFDLRMEIADLLSGMGHDDLAARIYRAVAEHNIKAGNPLGAIVAIKLLEQRELAVEALIQSLQDHYSFGSTVLGRSVKLAPTDLSQQIREDIDLDYLVDQRPFIAETAAMAASTDRIEHYPSLVPPVSIFSSLEKAAFGELLHLLTLARFHPNDRVVTQGATGTSLYFIARGEVNVVKRPGENAAEIHLARLGPGSLFGEMALLSDAPRTASVVAATEVDLLALSRSDVEALSQRTPQVAGAMARFTRERMINTLLATNPLFSPFGNEDKKKLLARFTGHDVPEGTIFLEQGDLGRGLYIVLQGKAEVMRNDGGKLFKIAEIGPGDIVGEMALVNEAPVSATVRTTTSATLLFLAREIFSPLVANVPELSAYFKNLSEARTEDAQLKVMAHRLSDDLIERLDDESVDLDGEDLILL